MIVRTGPSAPGMADEVDVSWKSLGDGFGSPVRAVCGKCRLTSLGLLSLTTTVDLAKKAQETVEIIEKLESMLGVLKRTQYDAGADEPVARLATALEHDLEASRRELRRLRSTLDRAEAAPAEPVPDSWMEFWSLSLEPIPGRPVLPIYTGYPDTGFRISIAPRQDKLGRTRGARPHVNTWYAYLPSPELRRALQAIDYRWRPIGQRPRLPCHIYCPKPGCGARNRLHWPAVLDEEASTIARLRALGLSTEQVYAQYRRGKPRGRTL